MYWRRKVGIALNGMKSPDRFKSSLFLNKNSAKFHLQTWVYCVLSNNTFKIFQLPLLLSPVLGHWGIMAFFPLVRCLQKKTALILIKAGSPHSAPSRWHWSVLETLWTFRAEAQILETTSRLVPRQRGNCSIPANCFLVWREFNADTLLLLPYEIPGEGYAGITPKSSLGGRNASMVESLGDLQILCSSGCQFQSHTTQHRRQALRHWEWQHNKSKTIPFQSCALKLKYSPSAS